MNIETPCLDVEFADHLRINYWYALRQLPRYFWLFFVLYSSQVAPRLYSTGSVKAFVPSHFMIVFVPVFITYFCAIHPLLILGWMKLSGRIATKLWAVLTDDEFGWKTEFVRKGVPWRHVRQMIEKRDGFYFLFWIGGAMRIPKRQLDQATIDAFRDYVLARIGTRATRAMSVGRM